MKKVKKFTFKSYFQLRAPWAEIGPKNKNLICMYNLLHLNKLLNDLYSNLWFNLFSMFSSRFSCFLLYILYVFYFSSLWIALLDYWQRGFSCLWCARVKPEKSVKQLNFSKMTFPRIQYDWDKVSVQDKLRKPRCDGCHQRQENSLKSPSTTWGGGGITVLLNILII